VTSSNWKTLWLGAPYFQQIRPIEIYRDGTKDDKIDTDIITKGMYGINFHHAGFGTIIDRWSAGCFVAPRPIWEKVCSHFINGDEVNLILI
jgi:hypothetical protein